MKIGVIGLGRMGSAMASRLLDRGHRVVGWDVDSSARTRSASGSLTIGDSAQSVLEASETIITAVPDDGSVGQLFFSRHGLLAGEVKGKLFVEMSTLRPATGVALSEKLGKRGAMFVDSPVLGSIPAARSGALIALVGGEAEAVSRASPILNDLTARLFHLGAPSSGYAMKLAVNLGLAGYIQGLSESVALGLRYGLSMQSMLEVMKVAPTSNAWFNAKLDVFLGKPGQTTLDLSTLRKDVMSAVAAGSDRGVAMPMTAATLSALSAAVASGWGARDCADQIQFFQQCMLQSEIAGDILSPENLISG